MVLTAWIFSRWMALIYLAAFWSLGLQILGLIGSHGILPANDFLNYITQQQGTKSFWELPTLCWLNHSDGFLLFLCWGGMGLSVLFLVGVMPGLTALLLWIFYMSLTLVGQDFLGFQWDNLLLEAGFLLIFLVPRPLGLYLKPTLRPSIVVIWLLRWLLFRLIFESGMVKLLSGDPNWANLTALTYHYWTQPLPNVISWYAAQLPVWFQQLSCVFLFAVELLMPFLIFGGRWGRLIAFFGITSLQVLIFLTGNYCFFNLLTIGLCLTLLEDEHFAFLDSVIPAKAGIQNAGSPIEAFGDDKYLLFYNIITGILAAFILTVSLSLMANSFLRMEFPAPFKKLMAWVEPVRSINNYGLFAVMTTERDEIILEGSNDGETWLPYEFPFKPGDVHQAPRWATPYQPRLDWQMWFASLGSWKENQWVLVLMQKLLQGDPLVLRLLAKNPFEEHPPRYIQATFWEYHFTDFKTRGAHGPWWRREIKGLYCPTMSLDRF